MPRDPRIASSNVTPNDLLGQAANATQNGNFASAMELFKTFLSAYPTHPQAPDAWLGLATALKRTGNIAGAGDAYRGALALRPNATAHFGLGECLRRQGHLPQALGECERGL